MDTWILCPLTLSSCLTNRQHFLLRRDRLRLIRGEWKPGAIQEWFIHTLLHVHTFLSITRIISCKFQGKYIQEGIHFILGNFAAFSSVSVSSRVAICNRSISYYMISM